MFPWTSTYADRRTSSSQGNYRCGHNHGFQSINAFTNPNTSSYQRPSTQYSYYRSGNTGQQKSYPDIWRSGSVSGSRGGGQEMTTSFSYSTSGGDQVISGSSGGGHSYGSSVKLEDKAELQRLNDRLSEYIAKVRQMWEQRSHVDSSSFIQSTRILEEEVRKLKELYECELANLRRQLQENGRDKTNLLQQQESFTIKIRDMEKSLAQENDKNRQMNDIINKDQQRISYLEQELAKVRSAPQPVDESPILRKQLGDLSRDKQEFQGRWENEVKLRKNIEGEFAAYKKKAEFDINVLTQQLNEMKQRLETTMGTIVTLETKVKEQGRSDTNVQDLLRQVRLAADEELKKHQSSTEAKYNRSLSCLKMQMESGAGAIGKLEGEKAQLREALGDLKARIAALEAQITALAQEKQSLEALIGQERATAAAQIKAMEKRFQELQQALFLKLQEAQVSSESYIPLKAEIEAMKILLAEEEKRLSTPVSYKTTTVTKTFNNSSTSGYNTVGGNGYVKVGGGQQSFKECNSYRPGGGSTYYSRKVQFN